MTWVIKRLGCSFEKLYSRDYWLYKKIHEHDIPISIPPKCNKYDGYYGPRHILLRFDKKKGWGYRISPDSKYKLKAINQTEIKIFFIDIIQKEHERDRNYWRRVNDTARMISGSFAWDLEWMGDGLIKVETNKKHNKFDKLK
jgi:hypothetical protein